MTSDNLKSQLKKSHELLNDIMEDASFLSRCTDAYELIQKALQNNNKILLAGNGGSASDAQHIAAELTGRYVLERKALPAIALAENSSHITAVANDFGYQYVFSRAIEALAQKGDVVILLSTSGNSENILNAAETCHQLGIQTIGMTGNDGGKLRPLVNTLINVPSSITARIQETHIMIGHWICSEIDNWLTQK